MDENERAALHKAFPELVALEEVLFVLEALPTQGARARALLIVTLKLAPEAFTDQQLMRLIQAAKTP